MRPRAIIVRRRRERGRLCTYQVPHIFEVIGCHPRQIFLKCNQAQIRSAAMAVWHDEDNNTTILGGNNDKRVDTRCRTFRRHDCQAKCGLFLRCHSDRKSNRRNARTASRSGAQYPVWWSAIPEERMEARLPKGFMDG